MKKWLMMGLISGTFFVFYCNGTPLQATGYGWGYKKSTTHDIPEIGKYQDMLKQYDAYYADDSGEKDIYLTFDNGYEQGYTEDILNVLNQENVPAAFFVTGHYVKEEPKLVKRMAEEGHIVGNHSYHHPDFTIMRKQEINKELEDLEEAVANVSSQKRLNYLRPPRGIFSENTLKWTQELGYTHIFWSLALKDWETENQQGWQNTYDEIMEQIHPGALILLHTVSSDNAEALEKVIKELKEQGYTFRSLDHLVLKNELSDGLFEFLK